MSKIVLLVPAKEVTASAIAGLRRATGRPLAEIQAALKESRPLLEAELFRNDHAEVDQRVRAVLAAVENHQLSVEVLELRPDEAFETCARDICRIERSTLLNILDDAQGRYH